METDFHARKMIGNAICNVVFKGLEEVTCHLLSTHWEQVPFSNLNVLLELEGRSTPWPDFFPRNR